MSFKKIKEIKDEILRLRLLLKQKEDELRVLENAVESQEDDGQSRSRNVLSKEEIQRFSRQIILSEVGTKGQLILKNSSVLIVGVGGLGCPAAQYLCGAGVGHIGLIDYDEVETNNLHRQLLHSEETIGVPKTTSAAHALRRLYSKQNITEYREQLNIKNALQIIPKYDVVVDASDNVATRYLLNDACVLSSRPLVSGSALRLEGQLTVYSYESGPCYRCLFPEPPPPETITNCGDGGVLGVVPGVIGILEALETIKILLNWPGVLSGQLLLFSADQGLFRKVRIRNKNLNCDVCGNNASIRHLIDYEQFCGSKATDKDISLKILDKNQRVTAPELSRAISAKDEKCLLLDVRDAGEFDMCSIEKSVNIPLKNLDKEQFHNTLLDKITEMMAGANEKTLNLYVICRRGNDSQKAVLKLNHLLHVKNVVVKDVEGGLHSWSKTVDSNFPVY